MMTRTAGYDDYGFSPGEEKQLKKDIRNGKVAREIVFMSALEANESISVFLVMFLTFGESYDDMNTRHYIPLNRGDFYAYSRKTLAIIRSKVKGIPLENKKPDTGLLRGQMDITNYTGGKNFWTEKN